MAQTKKKNPSQTVPNRLPFGGTPPGTEGYYSAIATTAPQEPVIK